MAHYREIPCEFYICVGNCAKGRKQAAHKGICQTCKHYRPRARIRLLNKKKQALNRIRHDERYD